MKDPFGEEKEKDLLKKTLSYYKKMPTPESLEENNKSRYDRRTIIIIIITTLITIVAISVIRELLK